MRCLHLLDGFDERGPVRALMHMLRLAALESAVDEIPVAHDVLALSGGPLESELRGHARRVTTPASGLELTAALLTGDYDVVQALDRRIARRLAPILTSGTPAAFVYSSPALERSSRAASARVDPAERAILAACDLAFLPPTSGAAPKLTASLAHRSVCLDLARLGEPPALAADGGPALDIEDAELRFIVREWAAALNGVSASLSSEAFAGTLHP
jgi:hypothetical protein